MKIVFTGGGTGGHFYPIIAVAEKVNKIIDQEHIIGVKLYYISDSPYDKEVLFENGLVFEQITAGKMRTYSSWRNFTDVFKVIFGTINAVFKMFTIYPDVVFGKGGYASLPTLLAARILRIPIVIHESDSAPGRVNKWAGRFARRVAISFEEAAEFFPNKTTAWTGQPIRAEIENPADKVEALGYFKFESDIPVVLILGGSQGAELINNTIIDALPRLVKDYQIIHQTGVNNYQLVAEQAELVLKDNPNRSRYISIPFLNQLVTKMSAGAATIIISRAGSALFEIASWGVPSILIPLTNTHEDHQKKNAFAYARTGACSVVEEANMTANILSSEIDRIIDDKEGYKVMAASAKAFGKPGAAEKIARVLMETALSHDK